MADQSASFQVTVNPLVNWIWFGFAMLTFGTGIALLPESRFAFLASKSPPESVGATSGVSTTILILAVMSGLSNPIYAQQGVNVESYTATTGLEAELQNELVCVCGDCPHYTLAACRCALAPQWITTSDGRQEIARAGSEFMRGQLREQIELGRSRREILDYFIESYGSQEPLGAPLDEGFNRFAWLFPYLVGVGCLIGVGVVAVRWSRRDFATVGGASSSLEVVDAELDARLDDELRNLD